MVANIFRFRFLEYGNQYIRLAVTVLIDCYRKTVSSVLEFSQRLSLSRKYSSAMPKMFLLLEVIRVFFVIISQLGTLYETGIVKCLDSYFVESR